VPSSPLETVADCKPPIALVMPKRVRATTKAAATSGRLLCPGGYQRCDNAERFCNRVAFKFFASGGSSNALEGRAAEELPENLRRYGGVYRLQPGQAHANRPVWQRERRSNTQDSRSGSNHQSYHQGSKESGKDLFIYFVDHGGLSAWCVGAEVGSRSVLMFDPSSKSTVQNTPYMAMPSAVVAAFVSKEEERETQEVRSMGKRILQNPNEHMVGAWRVFMHNGMGGENTKGKFSTVSGLHVECLRGSGAGHGGGSSKKVAAEKKGDKVKEPARKAAKSKAAQAKQKDAKEVQAANAKSANSWAKTEAAAGVPTPRPTYFTMSFYPTSAPSPGSPSPPPPHTNGPAAAHERKRRARLIPVSVPLTEPATKAAQSKAGQAKEKDVKDEKEGQAAKAKAADPWAKTTVPQKVGGVHFRLHMLLEPHRVGGSTDDTHNGTGASASASNSSSGGSDYHRRGFCEQCTPGFFGQCQHGKGECAAVAGTRQCPYRFHRCFAVPPYKLRYVPSKLHFIKGLFSTQRSNLHWDGGAPTAFRVAPLLPTGLHLNSQTGTITGVPQEEMPLTPFHVLGANTGGEAVATLLITVDPPPSSAPTLAPTGTACAQCEAAGIKHACLLTEPGPGGGGTFCAPAHCTYVATSRGNKSSHGAGGGGGSTALRGGVADPNYVAHCQCAKGTTPCNSAAPTAAPTAAPSNAPSSAPSTRPAAAPSIPTYVASNGAARSGSSSSDTDTGSSTGSEAHAADAVLPIALNGPTDVVIEAGQRYIEQGTHFLPASGRTSGQPKSQGVHPGVQRLVVKVDEVVETDFDRYDMDHDGVLSEQEMRRALGLGHHHSGVDWSNCISSGGSGGGCNIPIAKVSGLPSVACSNSIVVSKCAV
jgi:hypothetical protein